MPHTPKSQADSPDGTAAVLSELGELCRLHDVSHDLLERSHDLDELLERILEEYEARLDELPDDAPDSRADSLSLSTARKLRALTRFASRAVALQARHVENAPDEAEQARQQLDRRHRLENLRETLETLSALSHKINNPLTALMGRAQLLRGYRDANPKVKKAVSVIEESATRVAELVRELAGVVRQGKRQANDELLAIDGGSERPAERRSR